jgi:hypothetical protein
VERDGGVVAGSRGAVGDVGCAFVEIEMEGIGEAKDP